MNNNIKYNISQEKIQELLTWDYKGEALKEAFYRGWENCSKELRSELEEAKKDMQITRDTEEEINNKLLGKNSDLQKENEELKKRNDNLHLKCASLVERPSKIKTLEKQLSELNDFRKNIELSIEAYPLYNNVLADEIRNRLQHIKESLEGEE